MFFKYHSILIKLIIFFSILITGCKLQDPIKTHGIIYLENRSNVLDVKKSNKNDVIKIMGVPHIRDEYEDESWIYFERILTKGKFHKLGQHVLKENNVLILVFDKYGILLNKQLVKKEDMNKLDFSELETENVLTKKSFVQKFLQSVRQKMYKN